MSGPGKATKPLAALLKISWTAGRIMTVEDLIGFTLLKDQDKASKIVYFLQMAKILCMPTTDREQLR